MIGLLIWLVPAAFAIVSLTFPDEIWVRADKNKFFWVFGLMVPGIGAITLVPFILGPFPALLLARRPGATTAHPVSSVDGPLFSDD